MSALRRDGTVAITAASVLLVVAGCGSLSPAPDGGADPASGGRGTSTPGAPAAHILEPGEVLVAHGILMQSAPERPVEICLGGVAESLPPQCGGPVLQGDFSWEDVEAERRDGVTWTNDAWWAVGTYTPEDRGTADAEHEGQGTFALARPVSAEPPAGYAVPTPQDLSFPQLCTDPYVHGDASAAGDTAAQQRLASALEDLEGYVTSWVSDGSSLYNVVVTSDPDAAFTALRKVWKGGLCVEQRELPTQDELLQAQRALTARFQELRLLSASAGGVSGQLEVEVVLTDRATVEAVLDAVSEWVAPADVRITGALRPLDPG
jgi:hypothetical protein